ncbi:hypothetical protein ENUP19_0078G0030 [Entamoeba nuttalli]|uniref:Fibronectin type III domain containing protein n=2 Tax=Entamoeba nuttalli TaxID=412467 RepID=K2HVS2_ENTNP|nr:hypothetical protein ENU1_091840 [Entamoeba nuttalli P19]EKE40390.1 hypothetical protein ENU1_091840 [Entamoeba nuttalli P19]|eukprot:XP_008857276.1 hypothetical protein ENU1_091840 [Entamoeba nuttalli P19]
MDLKEAFENKLEIINTPSKSDPRKFNVTVNWTEPTQLNNSYIIIGLYAHKRKDDKNYITYEYVKESQSTYSFNADVPAGYYDIRICTYSGMTRFAVYTRVCELSKYFVGKYFAGKPVDNDFTVKVERKQQDPEILVSINLPAEDGDFIGMFEASCLSMKDNYMIGLQHTVFGEGNLQRYFDINLKELGDTTGKEYQIRYFRKDCEYKNKLDISRVPFAFSEPFKL